MVSHVRQASLKFAMQPRKAWTSDPPASEAAECQDEIRDPECTAMPGLYGAGD